MSESSQVGQSGSSPMQEIAPGVMVPGGARRVLYRGDPGEAEYLAAQREVKEIRRELARLRGRLEAVGRIETEFWPDHMEVVEL